MTGVMLAVNISQLRALLCCVHQASRSLNNAGVCNAKMVLKHLTPTLPSRRERTELQSLLSGLGDCCLKPSYFSKCNPDTSPVSKPSPLAESERKSLQGRANQLVTQDQLISPENINII